MGTAVAASAGTGTGTGTGTVARDGSRVNTFTWNADFPTKNGFHFRGNICDSETEKYTSQLVS